MPDIQQESLFESKEVQRVMMLLTIVAIGFILRGRFPGGEAGAVQKMLLQVLVPASLFEGLAKEKIEWSHLGYIMGGVLLVIMRLCASLVVCYAVLGTSKERERASLRRTAIFEITTSALALSVLPFVGEFIAPEYAGYGGMVYFPVLLYMLLVQPPLLKHFGEGSGNSDTGGGLVAGLLVLLKDPIPLSLIFGLLTALVTEGGGVQSLGFAGKAVSALGVAQTPTLFLLIGFKLNFNSAMPLYGVTLLLAVQGVLLIMTYLLLVIIQPNNVLALFALLFVQGAPSIVGMGVMKSVIDSGIQGYSADFAFDIVGLGFPISSLMQCTAGVMGDGYINASPFVGAGLIVVAVVMRIVFAKQFAEKAPDGGPDAVGLTQVA